MVIVADGRLSTLFSHSNFRRSSRSAAVPASLRAEGARNLVTIRIFDY